MIVTNFKIFENNSELIKFKDDIISAVKEWSIKNNVDFKTYDYQQKNKILLLFSIVLHTEVINISNKIIKFVDSLKSKLLNENIMLSYDFSFTPANRPGYLEKRNIFYFDIYLKKIKIKKVKPDKYVYHSSKPENRKLIEENGLIPKTSNEWQPKFHYPPAIFAINEVDSKGRSLWQGNIHDVWRIDTTNLPNEWWSDLNIGHLNYGSIMTFDTIPPEYLTLISIYDPIKMTTKKINI